MQKFESKGKVQEEDVDEKEAERERLWVCMPARDDEITGEERNTG